MEFFDKIGKKASEAYKVTADKTGKIAKDTKIKLKINDLKSKVNDIYEEIGKKVYEKHIAENDIDIEAEIEEKCAKIDELSAEIDSLLKQSLTLRDKKQCPKCYTEMNKDVNFCPNCGEKQEERVSEAEPEIIEEETKAVEPEIVETEIGNAEEIIETVPVEPEVQKEIVEDTKEETMSPAEEMEEE